MGSKYVSQSIIGYNSSPPPDDGSTSASNKITWAGIKTKLADTLNTFIAAVNTQLVTALDYSNTTQSSAYTTVAADHQKPIEVTGTTTISLGDASTMAAGYQVTIANVGTGVVTVGVANVANTLDGTTNGTTVLFHGQACSFGVNSTANGYVTIAGGRAALLPAEALTTSTTITQSQLNKVLFSSTSGAVYTLPSITQSIDGSLFVLSCNGDVASPITVVAGGTDTFGDGVSPALWLFGDYIILAARLSGTRWQVISSKSNKRKITTYTTGSGTHTSMTGGRFMRVRMVGGGSGGGANGSGATAGSAGGNTTFGASLTAGGGASGATSNATPVAGGTATGGDINIPGGQGGAGSSSAGVLPGGQGGNGIFGGGGASGGATLGVGQAAATNSGAGGGGAGGTSGAGGNSCSGGSAGGYVEKNIYLPSATYAYSVGAGGNGGSAGAGGSGGGNGAAGLIVVEEWC